MKVRDYDEKVREIQEMIRGLSSALVVDELGTDMKSYALDTNILINLMEEDSERKVSYVELEDRLAGIKSTIYLSTIIELWDVIKDSYNYVNYNHVKGMLPSMFKIKFNKPQFRIVNSDEPYTALLDDVCGRDPEVKEFIEESEKNFGKADCHYLAQSYLEGNTVYTFDSRLANACKCVGIPVIEAYKMFPIEYNGKWK